jgi:hypothetical protein
VSALGDEIDRTALCIHTLAQADGRIRERMVEIGAPAPSLLIVLATVLARRSISFDDIVLMQRYTSPDDLQRIVDVHVRAAMFAAEGDGWAPTDAARRACRRVIEVQGELITDAWRGADASLVASIVAGVPPGSHAAFDQQRDVLPDAMTDEHRLLRLVTVLRYLKSDVHAAALARHGITPLDAPDVERRWRDGEAIPERDAVETETDRDLVTRLGGREDDLLALLRSLPGVDPRR